MAEAPAQKIAVASEEAEAGAGEQRRQGFLVDWALKKTDVREVLPEVVGEEVLRVRLRGRRCGLLFRQGSCRSAVAAEGVRPALEAEIALTVLEEAVVVEGRWRKAGEVVHLEALDSKKEVVREVLGVARVTLRVVEAALQARRVSKRAFVMPEVV